MAMLVLLNLRGDTSARFAVILSTSFAKSINLNQNWFLFIYHR